jgi:tetratricopeptide (TPR) repeat protein
MLAATPLQDARDRQDRATLQHLVNADTAAAKARPKDADAQYQLALAQSYLAEVEIEVHDKSQAFSSAEAGIDAAEHAVDLRPNSSEYNRILGTLCGQAISSAGFAGLRHGKCALDSIDKAVQLDPKSSDALNPNSAEAWLWLGIALRKANQPAEAHRAIEKSVALNPNRVWAKQQLAKTPAK